MESTWVGIISIITDQILPFVAPVSGYLIFMVAAIMADSITGVLASLKENQKITSNGIWRTLEKIVIAGIAIMLSHGFETLWIPDIPMTKA
ncbi:MAG TPA: phage holin family protein, partial [Candidatus Woesebacteria bacterium]|nr:phage holin family protein [Candidatus Woesebacteria bacterium]